MKKAIAIVLVVTAISCTASKPTESGNAARNTNNMFLNMKKVECRLDIEKKIGRQLSVQ